MTATPAETRTPKVQLCSLVSEASGEDPIGSAWSTKRYIFSELPLPWGYELLSGKNIPPGLKDFIYGLYAREIYWGFGAIAPDPDYTVPGHIRVIEHVLHDGATNGYTPREFLVPTEEYVPLLKAYAEDFYYPDVVRYQQPRDPEARDIFVCTHGAVDACCAKFGYPVYRELKRLAKDAVTTTRVWRCSHFGGHRFAPTLLEMPAGRYWGRLKAHHLGGLINHDQSGAEMRLAYRGSATLPHTIQQVAEGEAFRRGGWEWARCAVTTSRGPEDPEAIAGTITFNYVHPDGEVGSITIDVIPADVIQTMGSSSSDEMHDAQQYECKVTALTPVGGLLDRPI